MSPTTCRFRISLSFSGEKREFVHDVAAELAKAVGGQKAILYDKYHEAEFARAMLKSYLPKLYYEQSDLTVAILSPAYLHSEWAGLEWSAILEFSKKEESKKVMLCRFEKVEPNGFYGAGYAELDNKSAEECAQLILERLAINEDKAKDHYTSRGEDSAFIGSANSFTVYRKWLFAKLEESDTWSAQFFRTLGKSDVKPFIPLSGVTTVGGNGHTSEARKLPLKTVLSERRSLIEGRPGSGKTTFTRLVAYELCKNSLNPESAGSNKIVNPEDKRIPLLLSPIDVSSNAPIVPLRDIANPDHLVQFLSSLSERQSWGLSSKHIQTLLENGNAILILDGLDELPLQDQTNEVLPLLNLFDEHFPKLCVLVTARLQIGQNDFSGFSLWQISELQKCDVIEFIQSLEKRGTNSLLKFVEQELNRDSPIRTLLTLPMTLAFFSVLYLTGQANLTFYSEVLSSICQWLLDSRKLKSGLTSSKRFNILRAIALAIQFGKEGVDTIRLSDCSEACSSYPGLEDFDMECYLREEARGSELIELKADAVRFKMPLLREFFAASGLTTLTDDEIVTMFTSVGFADTLQASIAGFLGALLEQDAPRRLQGLLNRLSPCQSQQLHERVKALKTIGDLVSQVARPQSFLQTDAIQALVNSVSDSVYSEKSFQEITIEDRVVVSNVIGQCGDKRIDNTTWINIDGGSFLMGAQASCSKRPSYHSRALSNEQPVHEVIVGSFEVSKYLVTVEEYGTFIKSGGYESKEFWSDGQFRTNSRPKRWNEQVRFPNRPVVGVSWFEAAAYCKFVGARLPTEEEWEFLARGKDRSYPWGDSEPTTTSNHCNHGGFIGHATAVGLFPLGNSPQGVCDLLGNVWEWCSNWFVAYGIGGDGDQNLKILRGASWYERPPGSVRSTYRGVNNPEERHKLVGFRLARTIQ